MKIGKINGGVMIKAKKIKTQNKEGEESVGNVRWWMESEGEGKK